MFEDGRLELYDDQRQAVVPHWSDAGVTYPRDRKPPKVVWQGPAGSLNVDQNQLLAKYDAIMAVDTGWDTIGEEVIAITTMVMVGNIVIDPPRWSADVHFQTAFEFHGATEPPEIVGWCEAIRRLEATPEIAGRVAIVVDSELDALHDFNSRKRALMGELFLPESVELIYASAERGTTENIGNAAIAQCDKAAKELLKIIKAGDISEPLVPVEGQPFRAYRCWIPPAAKR